MPTESGAVRPQLDAAMGHTEFRRWYWTMAELQPFARRLKLPSGGPKADLADRIPRGQRSTQALRAFFEHELGSGFTFNGHVRAFLNAGGATLGEAADHYRHTLGTPLPRQSESLEFNRFVRAWHMAHPDGNPAECRAAWATNRALPVEQRPPLPGAP